MPSPAHSNICVVVPVYNRARAVAYMLDSLEKQTIIPGEVILVDNNSSDDSLQVLQKWADKMRTQGWDVKVAQEKRPGASAARKKGEEMTTMPYLAFFDSDDTMHPDYLEAAMRDFEADPHLQFTVWNLTFNHPDGSTSRRRIMPAHPLENHLVQGLLSTQAFAVRTDFLRQIGGWNPAIGGWDDWELGLRLLLGGGKFKITDESRSEFTVQAESISGLNYLHRKGDWENTLSEMDRILTQKEHFLSLKIIRHAQRLLAYRRAILAAHYHHEGDRNAARQLLRTAM
ncbi:MAG: glycosyltransferase family 2 protein, partial [Muribaculaceae bacterium]|nr:glycosyltransferase family 2 protein [Muribaculaceae bacterium]